MGGRITWFGHITNKIDGDWVARKAQGNGKRERKTQRNTTDEDLATGERVSPPLPESTEMETTLLTHTLIINYKQLWAISEFPFNFLAE